MSYIIITPVHNESEYLPNYIDSIINQTFIPKELLLVDDSSTDDSAQIIKNYAENYSWITFKFRESEQKKVQGSKVVEAFNFGIKNKNLSGLEFISKIDADLELPKDYFEKVREAFKSNLKYGIIGGYILELEGGEWIPKLDSNYHVRGALKSYRIKCYNNIDGLMPVLGWDGLDEMKAFYFGWKTKNLELPVKHFRPAASDYNKISLTYKIGMANYKNGGNMFMAIVRTIVRSTEKPYIINGISFFLGYFVALLKQEKKNVDKDLSKFINNFHFQRLKRKIKLKKNEETSLF